MIIKNQIQYLKDKDLGFDQDNLVVMSITDNIYNGKVEVMKTALTGIPQVKSVALVSNVPGEQFNQHPIYLESNPRLRADASEMFIDEDAANTLGIELAEGRMFDRAFATDSAGTNFILNETAIQELGVEDPIGKQLYWENNDELVKGTIIGVVKDFHYNSLHVPIRPLIMMMNPNSSNYFLLKVAPENLTETMQQAEAKFNEISPGDDFSYQFLDGQIEELYQEEARTLKLTVLLSAISIFLACGGLLGIVSIVIKQRIKEISIRKVLGASVRQILWLMNIKYLIVTGIAILVAVPLSIYFMQDWLGNFTYQSGISPFVYGITAVGVVALIALATSMISIRTVSQNPADNLRSE